MQRNKTHLFRLITIFTVVGFLTGQEVWGQDDTALIEYGKALLKIDEKNIYETTVDALTSYLMLDPAGEKAAEVQFLLGNLHLKRNRRDRAYISYLKTMSLYSESSLHVKANESARLAISKDRNLSPIKEKLYSLLITPPRATEFADTYFTLLQALRDLVYPRLYDALISECQIFMETFPDHPGAVQSAVWIGDMFVENNKYWDAVAAYYKVIHLYKGRGFDTLCRQKTAELMTERLKNHDAAIEIYREILKSDIDSVAHSESQWKMALIVDEKLKDHRRAVQEYQVFIDRFADSPHGPEALMKKAKIHVSNLKQYTEGIDTYREIVGRFPESDLAPIALSKAGEVYEKNMKDYPQAVKVYLEGIELYPAHPLSSGKLYDAAEITEKKLKEIGRALEMYRNVVEKYSSEKIAEKARKKIEDLTKED